MDTTTRQCKICEQEFDSIYDIDNGVCDECKKLKQKIIEYKVISNPNHDKLNELGAAGWELVSVTAVQKAPFDIEEYAYLKRNFK